MHGLTLTRPPDTTAAGEQRLAGLGCRRISALVIDAHDHAAGFWSAAGYTANPTLTRYVKML